MIRSTWLDGLEIMLLSRLLQWLSTVIACIGHSALAAVLACDCYSGYFLGLFVCLNIFERIMFTVIMFPQWIRHNNMSCVFFVLELEILRTEPHTLMECAIGWRYWKFTPRRCIIGTGYWRLKKGVRAPFLCLF